MTPRRSATRLAVSLGLGAVLALGACSGDHAAAPAHGSGHGTSAHDTAKTTRSPLAEFLGWDQGSDDGGPTDQQRHQERLVQDVVAKCMQTQGFEYRPVDPSPQGSGGDGSPFALSPKDFAAKYGYGITTLDGDEVAGGQRDPNQAIVDALSPSAQNAYKHALYGDAGARPLPGWIKPLPGAAGEADTSETAEDGGCYQRAQDQVYGKRGAEPEGLSAVFAELDPELTALQDRIDREPRVEAAQAQWADCMADAGHPEFTAPNEPPEVIRTRFTKLAGLDGATADGAGPRVEDSPELHALQDYERDVAQADLRCRATYDTTRAKVRVELEKQFIADHRDLLERYRELAALADGRD